MLATLPGPGAGAPPPPFAAVMMTRLTSYLLGAAMLAVIVLGMVAWNAFVGWWDRKFHPPVPDGCCVACGSGDLEILAPGVYRCRACGYEGGGNRPAWAQAQRQATWAGRPWPERIAAARRQVQDALRQLLALEPDVRDWPAERVVAAYSATWEEGAFDQGYAAYAGERFTAAEGALCAAIVEATAPLHAAGDMVADLGVPGPEDPGWDGEPQEIFARARAAATAALTRIDQVEATVQAGGLPEAP